MPAATSAEEDLADVNRVLAGEVQAFEGIVRRWQGPLVNMAWRYCRDRGRAEEMAQEAFLRAWRGLAGWRRESSFSTWLFALAANVFRSELQRFPAVNVPLEEAAEPAGPATQHEGLAKEAERRFCKESCAGAAASATASRWCSTTFTRWMWRRRRAPWVCLRERSRRACRADASCCASDFRS